MPKLIAHQAPNDVIAYMQRRALTAADYVYDCILLAKLLPDAEFLLNFCKNRYLFTVGMGAAALRRQTMLLPPTHNQEMLAQLQKAYPEPYILYDYDALEALEALELPYFKLDSTLLPSHLSHNPQQNFQSLESDLSVPEIPANHVMAYVFTSGSTGKPEPHVKTWGNLCRNAQAQLCRIMEDINFGDKVFSILATVPPQHMYGFESSVLLALQGKQVLSAAHPFYPQDICMELECLPHPRVLVSTPFHLKMLMESNLTLPAVDLIISATASMSSQLAASVEAKFHTTVQEIYGCTETGQIATRLPTSDAVWCTYGQVEIVQSVAESDGASDAVAQGDYIATPTELNDVLEIIDRHRFKLLGRKTDMINIAGKRSSLNYLNHQLNTIAGVQDGVFFMPQTDKGSDDNIREERLAAFVVASDVGKIEILQALRARIDAVFIPRPLYMVDTLPRNSAGKLPYQLLAELAQRLRIEQDGIS